MAAGMFGGKAEHPPTSFHARFILDIGGFHATESASSTCNLADARPRF
jgi:hypothetical protein